MMRKYIYPVMLCFALYGGISAMLYAGDLKAGKFRSGKTLDMGSRIRVRNNDDIHFTESVTSDVDLDGIPDSIVADNGLKIIRGSAEPGKKEIVSLSDKDGAFAVYDMNDDGTPDILQEQGLGQIVLYQNIPMPALRIDPVTFPEDSVSRIAYRFRDDGKGELGFFPSVSVPEISVYPDSAGFTVMPLRNWYGKAEITVIYGRGDFMDTVRTTLHVLPVNDPPVKSGDPPLRRIPEDTPLQLYKDSLLSYFHDPDPQDELHIRQALEVKNITENDSLFIYRPEENWHGNDTLCFLVSDGEYRDTLSQPVIVEAVNDAPQWKAADTLKMEEDQLLRLPYSWLYDHAEDVETPDTLLHFGAFSGEKVSVSLEGNRITVLPEQDWYGRDSLKFTVSDGELQDTLRLQVTVAPVNDTPVLHELPDIAFNEDDTLFIGLRTLRRFAEDVETPREQLKWQAVRLGKVRAFYDGSLIRLTAPPDWFGTDSIRLTVSDGELNASRNWTIRVRPVNDPPQWQRRSMRRSFLEDDTLRISRKELYRYASDPETPDEELKWELLPSPELYLETRGDDHFIYVAPDWYGRAHIRMIVSDGVLSDTCRCRIRVVPVNDPPRIGELPEQTWPEDDTLTLSREFLERFASGC
ncbi:MAG: tandem-95 repeat protein [Candidatus Marinimicrobia bacterium]|nr:tandem-95 repeat protein [Candidatus Neomarinimicrobiota bacterium]